MNDEIGQLQQELRDRKDFMIQKEKFINSKDAEVKHVNIKLAEM